MVGTLLSGSLLHFTLSYDLMTVLREGEKQQRGRRELKLRPKGSGCSKRHTRCVLPHHASLCLTLPFLPFLSLAHSLSHIICSLSPPFPLVWSSLFPSQAQQAGNTSESCDWGAKNTAGVVFASLGTFPANSIKAWIYSFWTASENPFKTEFFHGSWNVYICSPPVCLNIILSHWASIPLIRYTARGGEKTFIWYTDIYDMGVFFQGKDLFCFTEIKF